MGFDPKTLKKLADACRKAGITHFKNSEMEFTLSPEAPVSNYKKKKVQTSPAQSVIDETFQSDGLTDDQLLMWSSADLTSEPGGEVPN